MADDVRIIAVSLEGGDRLEHITHVWTQGGVLATQRAVEDLWSRRCRYYTVTPGGRIDVLPLPRRGPNPIERMLGRKLRGSLASERPAGVRDGLLMLPRLPSPTRPRRSRAMQTTSDAVEV